MTFFLLYMTEGIPQGFASVAVAMQMRRQGLSPLEVGAFTATLYLPWAYKVFVGPAVDLLYSERLGKRRGWIVACQFMMAATLLAAWPIDFTAELWLFSAIIFVHNIFAATQDVAIDALAVDILTEQERGVASGFMFAGSYSGSAIGGAGVLYLSAAIGFSNSFWLVAGSILLITVFISMRIREPRRSVTVPQPTPDLPQPTARDTSIRAFLGYLRTLLRSMFSSRPALAGFAFALLPSGAFAIGLTLRANLLPEFGVSDTKIATINLIATVLAAAGCVAGGYISDRVGRRKAIAVFVLLTLVPSLALAWLLQRHGWIMPVDLKASVRPVPSDRLVSLFIGWSYVYAVVIGLIYGSRSAGYMDISHSAVAATQFTAYMSLMNLALSYSSFWQGWAAKAHGYPVMLVADCLLGLLCLIPLAWMSPRKRPPSAADAHAPAPTVQQPAIEAGSR